MKPLDAMDVSIFPSELTYECGDGSIIDFASVLAKLRSVIEIMEISGLFRRSDTFGLAISRPYFEGEEADCTTFQDNPETHVAFVGGWGEKQDQCIANAVRKMRPLYRGPVATSTLDMRLFDEDFEDVVKSIEDDGTFLWGDFPYGGAVWVIVGDVAYCVSVSGLHQVDDHAAAVLYGTTVSKKVLIGDGLLAA